MRVITLEGDHYQMGLQHGRQLVDMRPRILEVIDRRLASLEGTPTTWLMREVERTWAVQARSTLDMLAGIAGALDLDAKRFLRYTVASYLEDSVRMYSAVGGRGEWRNVGEDSRSEGCTVWAASGPATADGSPILAKNRDYNLAHLDLQILARATPQHGYRYLYVTSAGSVGVYSSGMNEKGLVVADTYVSSSDIGPGLARYTLMMELLEHHASVASALRHLRSVPQMGGGNLILCDARGKMAVFETGWRHSGTVYARGRIVAATNHFVTPALRGHLLGYDGSPPGGESEFRLRSIRRRLHGCRGGLDAEWAMRIMASHADGDAAICRHALQDGSGTISTVVFFPLERNLLFCGGRPCESRYANHSI